MDNDTTTIGWAIVEMLGHRRVAGHLTEVQIAGAGFLRLDIPATPGREPQTQLIGPASIYAIHPVTEEVAVAMARRGLPAPVYRWELDALPGPTTTLDHDHWTGDTGA